MRPAIERRLDPRACSSKEAGTDRRSNRRPRVAASEGDKENGKTLADCRAEVRAELDAAQDSARGGGEGDALKLAARKPTVVEARSGSMAAVQTNPAAGGQLRKFGGGNAFSKAVVLALLSTHRGPFITPHSRINRAAPSFRDDAVRPFHERDKDCGITEFCAPLGEIGVSHSTGTRARATRKNLNLLRHNFLQRFL